MKIKYFLFFAFLFFTTLNASNIADLRYQMLVDKASAELTAKRLFPGSLVMHSGLTEKCGVLSWYFFLAKPNDLFVTEIDVATLNGMVLEINSAPLAQQQNRINQRILKEEFGGLSLLAQD